jgi:hypothetical protein
MQSPCESLPMIRRLALVILVAACGGKQPAPATAAGSGSGSNAAAAEHEEMATMPPAVAKFHDVLAPRWHAEQGPKRMQDTCAALPDFHSAADAIGKATPPTTANADVWTTATKGLVDAVAGLDAPCAANDSAQFEAAFAKLHDSFHFLLEAAGGQVK